MTSSLHKKRRITRRNILRWMRDSIHLSVGLSCLWGLSNLGQAADATTPRTKSSTVVGRSTVDAPTTARGKTPANGVKKITRTAQRVVRAQNPFEEPAIEERQEVIPPPEPSQAAPPAPQEDALKRLRDRSAKARWDQLHQEWLKARKNRLAAPQPEYRRAPAVEQPAESSPVELTPAESTPAESSPVEENPFEPNLATENTSPESNSPTTGTTGTTDPSADESLRRPGLSSGRVFLQSQQKSREQLPTEDELNKLLNADNGQRLPPPVRDPAALPKITEINPNPEDRPEPVGGRPVIPEQDPKLYIQLGNTPFTPRTFPEFTYNFEATNVWSNPLYFEDPALERYGHTLPPLIQPIASVARFGAQVVFLPYQMTVKPLDSKIYPLGWYLPGDYVPYRLHQPGWNTKAAAVQAATILGVGYVTP